MNQDDIDWMDKWFISCEKVCYDRSPYLNESKMNLYKNVIGIMGIGFIHHFNIHPKPVSYFFSKIDKAQ